ncbi:MAG TPA: hypothetical protein VF188_17510 [Longimicrobiales bacterium]
MNLHRSALVLLPLAAFGITACASGSAIVTGTPRDPIPPEQVVLYLEPPAEYEVIGLVYASTDAGWTQQQKVDAAIKELKKQAAKLGANGVLLESVDETSGTLVAGHGTGFNYAMPVTDKHFQGKAILVEKQ